MRNGIGERWLSRISFATRAGQNRGAFLVRACVMLSIFVVLSLWHNHLVGDIGHGRSNPYAFLGIFDRLPSPAFEFVKVFLVIFLSFGIWPAAVSSIVTSYLFSVGRLNRLLEPVLQAAAYLLLHPAGYVDAWGALFWDYCTAVVMLAFVAIPFSVIGEKARSLLLKS